MNNNTTNDVKQTKISIVYQKISCKNYETSGVVNLKFCHMKLIFSKIG